jgi:exodeoxyribonuclease VII large subunit
MREQINGWQQRLNQAWSVRMDNWKRSQVHYQSQLEMLNPQRTLERGYSVILKKNKEEFLAVRSPAELNTSSSYQVRLAEGQADVQFADMQITLEKP